MVPGPPPGALGCRGSAVGTRPGLGRGWDAPTERCPPAGCGGPIRQCGEPGAAAAPEGLGNREPRAAQRASGRGPSEMQGCQPQGGGEPSPAGPKATGRSPAVQGPRKGYLTLGTGTWRSELRSESVIQGGRHRRDARRLLMHSGCRDTAGTSGRRRVRSGQPATGSPHGGTGPGFPTPRSTARTATRGQRAATLLYGWRELSGPLHGVGTRARLEDWPPVLASPSAWAPGWGGSPYWGSESVAAAGEARSGSTHEDHPLLAHVCSPQFRGTTETSAPSIRWSIAELLGGATVERAFGW